MKVFGIIAEFNPFHNGHAHLLRAARERFGADHIVVVMSGDHVQRGEPALLDKYRRTHCALRAGADLVLELPVPFATGSAQYFARGAVAALLNTGVIDAVLFGSECGDIDRLRASASAPAIQDSPAHTGRHIPSSQRPAPNDLLAAEYLRAFSFFHSEISVFTIPRTGAGYHDREASGCFAGATLLRERLLSEAPASDAGTELPVSHYMPEDAFSELQSWLSEHRFLSLSDYSEPVWYALMRDRSQGYAAYFDVYEDLSRKILGNLEKYEDIHGFLTLLKSREIAYSHLSRALLHIMLGITKKQVHLLTDIYHCCPWLRILGLRKNASDLLHSVKHNAGVPVLSKLADAGKNLTPQALSLLQQDIFSSECYARYAAPGRPVPSEARRGIVAV